MQEKLLDIIDFDKVNILLEGFNKTSGFVTAILDLEGNVLSRSGWRKACTVFHRVHPETAKKCTISDTVLAGKLEKGEKYHFYKCLNGLIDVAVPIVINGVHIANLFSGQFFFEKPKIGFFKLQAKTYGFDEKIYLDAIKKVPVVPEEEVKTAMGFLLNMTELIADMSMQKLEQVELSNAIKESERKYRLVFEHMLEAMAYHKILFENGKAVDYIYLEVNDAFEEHTGMHDVVGKKVSEIVPGIHKNNPDLIKRFERVALTKQPEQYETFIKSSKTWYFTSLYYLGQDVVVSVFSNITERKLAETKVQESEANLMALINNTNDSIWSLDTDYKYIIFNKAYSDIFFNNYGFEVKKGMDAKKQLLPDELLFWEPMFDDVFQGERKVFEYHYPIEGELRYYQTSLNPIYKDEKVIGASALSVDVTNIKQAEQEIKKLNEDLEQKIKHRTQELVDSQEALVNLVEDLNEKSELLEKSSQKIKETNKELESFTYSVSHDLKAPLRGIDGYSKLLLDLHKDSLNHEAQTFLNNIRSGTNQMNQLIEDLLTYSRLERATIRTKELDLRKLIYDVIGLYSREIKERNIKLTVDVDNAAILADYNGLTIAIRNLLENAIKFTKTIPVPIIHIKFTESKFHWVISFKDNGVGFNMAYHDRIFEIFQRLHHQEDYPGTGIGLALVNKAMARMGGAVTAKGKINSGATFYLKIPKN